MKTRRLRGDKNPVFRGALGFWSNVLLLENEYVPWLDISVSGNSFVARLSVRTARPTVRVTCLLVVRRS
ncbi:MAG: DUF4043 family protein [Elusimicrobia bacterium]|nr:DUF4043 family protein [Elusimicrobiota bacterium]